MTKEEAIKVLTEMRKDRLMRMDNNENDVTMALQKAIFAIEKSTKELEWIPVTENTLPDEGKVVVVCNDRKSETWDFGTYRGHTGNINFWRWKNKGSKKVCWWMYKEDLPLPTND